MTPKHRPVVLLVCAAPLLAQAPFTPGVKPFLAVDAPVVALQHVRIIDGTGAAPREDQTIVIDHGRIAAAGSPRDPAKRITVQVSMEAAAIMYPSANTPSSESRA